MLNSDGKGGSPRGGQPSHPHRVIVLATLWTAVVTLISLRGFQHAGGLFARQPRATSERWRVLITISNTTASSSSGSSSSSSSAGIPVDARTKRPLQDYDCAEPKRGFNVSTASVACNPLEETSDAISPKESELQQQRRCTLQQAGGQPEGGYLAICLAVKNQHRDLPEWLDYHRALGVSHFYIMDDHSDPPLDDVLAPYAQDGIITHRRMSDYRAGQQDLLETACHLWNPEHKQMIVYNYCLRDYGARHQFMAFIDADEFLVINDGTPDLPTLLRDYEAYGGLGVNWRMFGSSGHKKRQPSTLLGYTDCFPEDDDANLHIKTIANMAVVTRMKGPHEAAHALGYYTVNTAKERIDGPVSASPEYSRLALHHYVTKSAEDYREKLARGSVMSDGGKNKKYWKHVQATSVQECTQGAEAWHRILGGAAAEDAEPN